MKAKLLTSTGVIIIMIITAITWISLQNNNVAEKLSVIDFVPDKKMIKVFSGGFENSGLVQVIDRIGKEDYQVKQIDFGAGMFFVYQVAKDNIKLIYSVQNDTDLLAENAENIEPNNDEIIIKEPIEIGATWKGNQGTYEITNVDVKVDTPIGEFNTIEIIYKVNNFISKKYYAKGLGLIKNSDDFGESVLIKIDYKLENYQNINDFYELLELE